MIIIRTSQRQSYLTGRCLQSGCEDAISLVWRKTQDQHSTLWRITHWKIGSWWRWWLRWMSWKPNALNVLYVVLVIWDQIMWKKGTKAWSSKPEMDQEGWNTCQWDATIEIQSAERIMGMDFIRQRATRYSTMTLWETKYWLHRHRLGLKLNILWKFVRQLRSTLMHLRGWQKCTIASTATSFQQQQQTEG